MQGRAVEAGRYPPSKIQLELRSIFLPETWRHQRSSHGRTDSLSRAGLRKDDVPEVDIGINECNAHESSFPLLPQGSNDAVHRLGGMLVEDFDDLAGNQRGIHKHKGPVGTHDVGGGLEVDGFAFGQAAAHRQRNLKGKARGTPTFGIASSLHKAALEGGTRGYGRNTATIPVKRQVF